MLITQLREDFRRALDNSKSFEGLLAIILRYKSLGVAQRETYDTLENLRKGLDQSFARDLESVRERLEDIMDRVWGYCSPADSIWDKPLSERTD